MVELKLPWPPSVNHYWRHVNNRVLVSKQGRAYTDLVAKLVGYSTDFFFAHERLAVHIAAYVPDRRRRDLDNVLKAALDALTKSGVWNDDEQIDELSITRMPREDSGLLVVQISPIVYTSPSSNTDLERSQ